MPKHRVLEMDPRIENTFHAFWTLFIIYLNAFYHAWLKGITKIIKQVMEFLLNWKYELELPF